jgi:hypothetical protein
MVSQWLVWLTLHYRPTRRHRVRARELLSSAIDLAKKRGESLVDSASPRLGQHSRQILASRLNLTNHEIDKLFEEEVSGEYW